VGEIAQPEDGSSDWDGVARFSIVEKFVRNERRSVSGHPCWLPNDYRWHGDTSGPGHVDVQASPGLSEREKTRYQNDCALIPIVPRWSERLSSASQRVCTSAKLFFNG
jgi:hypothetical protein